MFPLLRPLSIVQEDVGSNGSVEARMRIRSGHQFSISWSARALTPRMSSSMVSSDPPWRRNKSTREGNRPSSSTVFKVLVSLPPPPPDVLASSSSAGIRSSHDGGAHHTSERIIQASATTPSARPGSTGIAAGAPGRSHAGVGGPRTGRPSPWSPSSCGASSIGWGGL